MTTARSPSSGGAKWIKELDAEMPAIDAARRVLTIRLRLVEKLLPRARGDEDPSPKVIHQLRVATRRAEAALALFAPCVSTKRLKKQRKRLKRIRRAAGAARQCDVHLQAVQAEAKAADDVRFGEALEVFADWMRKRREEAAETIDAVTARYSHRIGGQTRLRKGRAKLLESLIQPDLDEVQLRETRQQAAKDTERETHAEGEQTFAALAAAELPPLFDAFAEAAGEDLRDTARLHQLRIRGKRLRYALELFRPCVAEGFDEFYSLIEGLQERLGEINDADEIVQQMQQFRDSLEEDDDHRETVAALLSAYESRREKLIQSFIGDWRRGYWRDIVAAAERAGLTSAAAAATPRGDDDASTESSGVTIVSAERRDAPMRAAG